MHSIYRLAEYGVVSLRTNQSMKQSLKEFDQNHWCLLDTAGHL